MKNKAYFYQYVKVAVLWMILLLMVKPARSQGVYQFTKGLAVSNVYHYGREAVYTDLLAWQLYNGTLKSPVADAQFGTDAKGQPLIWKSMEADTARRFRGRSLFGGYLYLTYQAEQEKSALLNLTGNSAVLVNGVMHTGDPYSSKWLYIPVNLKKGLNQFYIRGQNIVASLHFSNKAVLLNTEDPTLPHIVLGKPDGNLKGSVVVINKTAGALKNLLVQSTIEGRKVTTTIPAVLPMSSRKIIFKIDASAVTKKNSYRCALTLLQNGRRIDTGSVNIDAVESSSSYMKTFVSQIDGSLQYYAITPKSGVTRPGDALFLSVHGAGVEAIGQARAYRPKDWGNLVAATNRRPRGFNWEDWGRLDALEVLSLGTKEFKPDPQHIYLTGHSMGGHGTWFLGATYPDKWAGIAPCSGYPTLKAYGSADGLIPDSSTNPLERMLIRGSNQSDVIKLANNYKSLGVYILHGDSDKVVSVKYARQMKNVLADFHTDYSYYEYPGGEHWFGDQSVDWKPIFDFFKWHKLAADSAINIIDFTTANPGISSKFRWVSVEQQEQPLQYSRIQLNRNLKTPSISGTTKNTRLLKIKFDDFIKNKAISISIDNSEIKYTPLTSHDSIYLVKNNALWQLAPKPGSDEKGPHRYGTFKEGFNYQMVLVYGTTGNAAENEWNLNKARYDAETWYYRGNGSLDVIADKDYKTAVYKNRNVVLYGNATTNSAWKSLLSNCPVTAERNRIKAGSTVWTGDDIGAYFVWPIKGTPNNSVSVITGTGLKGLNAAGANQYLAGGSGFPDIFVFRLNMLQSGNRGVEMAGFYDNDWKLTSANTEKK